VCICRPSLYKSVKLLFLDEATYWSSNFDTNKFLWRQIFSLKPEIFFDVWPPIIISILALLQHFDTFKSCLGSFYDLCLRLRTTVLPILRIKKRLKMNINWYKLIKLICFVTWNYSTFICACMDLGFQKHYFGHKIEIINLHWKLLLLKKEKEIADFNQVKTQKSVNAHWEFCNG